MIVKRTSLFRLLHFTLGTIILVSLSSCAEAPPDFPRDKNPDRKYQNEDSTSAATLVPDGLMISEGLDSRVDLTPQFGSCIEIQKGGTCHVFSSAALLEAACYRRLKTLGAPEKDARINFSEARIFATHLERKFKNMNAKDISLNGSDWSLTPYDGGSAYDNLVAMIQNDAACSDEAIPFDGTFRQSLDSARSAAITLQVVMRMNPALAKDSVFFKEAFQKSFCNRMQNFAQCNDSDAEPVKDPNAEKIRRCFDTWPRPEVKSIRFSETEALKLLNRGLPFICTGNLKLGNTNTIGMHATTIVGYQQHDDPADHSKSAITWLIRDSNYSDVQANWQISPKTLPDGKTRVGCNYLIWVE